jgi:abnormal spindle-like microcephaly-associated protein
MLRRISATPCPVPASTDLTSRRDSIFDAITTTNIDFTTDFTRANLLTGVKPRRRHANVRKEVVIYEDEPQKDADERPAPLSNSGGSLLARPAKRLRGRVSFVGDAKNTKEGHAKPARLPLGSIAETEPQVYTGKNDTTIAQQPRRRISTVGPGILKEYTEEPTMTSALGQATQEKRTLAKPPRRGTIYVPPDDTTMPSLYMGIFSPIKDLENEAEKLEDTSQADMTGIAAEMAKRRGRRSSLAAEPARRVGPMRSVLGVVKEQESSNKMNASQDVDRVGAATGKENFPQGFHRKDFAHEAKCNNDSKTSSRGIASYARPVQRRQTMFLAPAPPQTNPPPEQRKPAWNSGVTQKPLKITSAAPKQSLGISESSREPQLPMPPSKIPSRFVLPKVYQEVQISQQYPPLAEDISNPAMYEESWLTHQEIAITQLLNNLFSATNSQEPVDPDLLRFELLDIYQSSPFVLLHRRLYGAILYGALRLPESILSEAKRLQNDLGIRKNFLDLWTRTYERGALRAALEVVVGRQCCSSLKGIRTFVEVFLIRNEDGGPDADCTDHVAWSYRRTLLRALMIIKLLDHIKTLANSFLTTSLFLTTSAHKTSMSVLIGLIQMLNPSMSQRALSHLEYTVEHKQHPLEEFEYPVTNLAVDLRDGVRLTRLVELLLYPSASSQLARESPEDTMMTLNMPTGEILSMLDLESPTKSTRYPLSQHLKFPCEGRAVKVFNAEIALTALRQVKSMRNIVECISAEDVVDGFREKTVAVLWGLTGKWGLGGLIDWKDVRSEISRFQRRKSDDDSDLLDEEELKDLSHTFTGYKTLLKTWAGAVASSRGLKVNNLTTSFADGNVFKAIVEEYETYLPLKTASPTSRKASLQERLSRLGCSTQFSSLFAPSTTGSKYQIFDRDFTLAALAFLCSRLLSASKRARTSVVIQRAWRSYQSRVEAHKQKMASMLASQCAEVVRTRERILGSKMKIMRAWRMYKAAGKKKVLDDDHEETNLDAGDLWLNL